MFNIYNNKMDLAVDVYHKRSASPALISVAEEAISWKITYET